MGVYATGFASAIAANKNCRIFYGTELSFDFLTITNDLSGTINIIPKHGPTVKDYTYSKTSFTFKCTSIVNPSATASADMSC